MRDERMVRVASGASPDPHRWVGANPGAGGSSASSVNRRFVDFDTIQLSASERERSGIAPR